MIPPRLSAIIILFNDDTMLTREKSDDTATHSYKRIIYVHAFQLNTGHESGPNPMFSKVGITVYMYRDLFIDIPIFLSVNFIDDGPTQYLFTVQTYTEFFEEITLILKI